MKNTFILITMLLTITACSKEQILENYDRVRGNLYIKTEKKENMKFLNPNTPIPEKPKITLNFLTDKETANKVAENNQYIENKTIQKDGSTIYYFTKEKDKNDKTIYSLTNDKQTAQFYRIVLGKTAENHCVVQDFYINDKKRTEKHIILDTDCTKHLSTNSNVSSRKNKNFSTFIVYEPQDKISVIDNLDRKNKIRNMYFYKDGKEDMIIHFDFNLNQQLALFFDMDKENPDITIRKFNEQQLFYAAEIRYHLVNDFFKSWKTKAIEWKDIDLNNNAYSYVFWGINDSKKTRVVFKYSGQKEEQINSFKEKYQQFINSKKMIDRP